MTTPVTLHVYDIANTDNENVNIFLKFVNNVSREVRAGGIYHGAIEVFGYEWSFGYCPNGSGVYKMKPTENKMYTFRESLPLGATSLSEAQFRGLLKQLQEEYQGNTYDLLTRNCCHFCEALTKELSCEPIPGWLNRFAYGADVTLAATNSAYSWVRGCADSTVSLWRNITASGQSLPSAEQQSDKRAEKEQLLGTSNPTFAVPSEQEDD